jgi:type I restriction enzyme R subunit
MDISERAFEKTIERTLLAGGPDADPEVRESPVAEGGFELGGYRRRVSKDHYDKALCLDPEMALAFIQATQPEEWDSFRRQHGSDARDRFLKRLAQQIRLRGTLDVLRRGIKADGCRFEMACFRPVSGMNPKLERLYQGNIFTVVRQLEYSQRDAKTVDLALFLNGLPIFTAELKNPLTGQNVQSAIRQYSFDRDPREPLFAYGRCLAHFAVDPDMVYLATHLEGEKTRFTPFNQGRNGGAGNPPAWRGFSTAYLWEQVWARDSVLNLIQHFIQDVEVEDEKGRRTGQRMMLFPRYHQLDSVRRLVADAKGRGTGSKYLIQHSAGSGKSNSIAWLAHQLSTLHDASDRRVFDSVVVITDRRVLDRQLQRTVLQFEQVLGVVENIDKTSRQLKQALEDGKKIIVTTLQKFPVIADEIGALPGSRFAVVVDEAHSSQTGESTKSLKQVLSAGTLEEAEAEESEVPEEDWEDRIAAEMRSRGPLPNVSYFAFTATPKPKTLELFGTQQPDGGYLPFSLYTMRQAIEEGYILDVLDNYTTYGEYWNLLKKIEDDPRYDRRQAVYLLKAFVSLHEHTIAEKVAIIVEHFNEHVRERIGGEAKAMIVTRSRLHAVRYKLALNTLTFRHEQS